MDPSLLSPGEDANLEDLNPDEEVQENQEQAHKEETNDRPEMSKVVENLTVAALREVRQIQLFLKINLR